MNSIPHPFKDGAIDVISDDALAQSIMRSLGVLSYFTQEAAPTTTIALTLADSHPTHWCLCARHSHNPDPSENGFQIIAYPKDTVDFLTIHAIIQQHLKDAKDVSVTAVFPQAL